MFPVTAGALKLLNFYELHLPLVLLVSISSAKLNECSLALGTQWMNHALRDSYTENNALELIIIYCIMYYNVGKYH